MGKTPDTLDIVDEILRFNAGRIEERLTLKYELMSQNVFAYFRGTDHLYARRWPRVRPADLGPSILQCGDLHLENFGAYETDDNDFRYDVNDFDEAIVAPCSLDLVRLTASILLAGEVWDVAASKSSGVALDCLAAYRDAVVESAASGKIGEVAPGKGVGPIWDLLGKTASGDRVTMLDHYTERDKNGDRRIARGDEKHPSIGDKKADLVREALREFAKTTSNPKAYQVLDVTGRIAGVGSLGLRRYTVLVAGGGTPETNQLLDMKEEIASSVLAATDCEQPFYGGNEAVRVVRAQCQLQSKPTAGLATLRMGSRDYRLRVMVPDENRSKIERLHKKPEKLRDAATVVGQLAAWSQLRGCREHGDEARQKLAAWASKSVDEVLAAALRCLDVTSCDFETYKKAFDNGRFGKPADK